MPAPSEEILWQIEEAFETAISAILNDAADIEAKVYRSREDHPMSTPWVEVKFLVGAVTEKYQHILTNHRWAYAGWSGSALEITVATHRKNNASKHRLLLGQVRRECQMYRLASTWPAQASAAYHVIADIRESGTVHVVDDENYIDLSTMSFSVLHNIHPSAWPTGLSGI